MREAGFCRYSPKGWDSIAVFQQAIKQGLYVFKVKSKRFVFLFKTEAPEYWQSIPDTRQQSGLFRDNSL